MRFPASSVKPTIHRLTNDSYVYAAANALTRQDLDQDQDQLLDMCTRLVQNLVSSSGDLVADTDAVRFINTTYRGSENVQVTTERLSRSNDITYTGVFLFGEPRTFAFSSVCKAIYEDCQRGILRPYPSATCSLVIFGSDVSCELLIEPGPQQQQQQSCGEKLTATSNMALVVPLKHHRGDNNGCDSPELFPSPKWDADDDEQVNYLSLSPID